GKPKSRKPRSSFYAATSILSFASSREPTDGALALTSHGMLKSAGHTAIAAYFRYILFGAVHHERIDFDDSIDRNPVALCQRQWMICGLKLNKWSRSVVAKVDPCLQIDRIRVGLEPDVQPTVQWDYM